MSGRGADHLDPLESKVAGVVEDTRASGAVDSSIVTMVNGIATVLEAFAAELRRMAKNLADAVVENTQDK